MSHWFRVSVSGPLAGFASGFAAELARMGYSPAGAEAQMRLMKHVSNWLAAQDLAVGDLSAGVVGRFVVARRSCYRSMRSARALVPLLGFLRRVGAAPGPGPVTPVGPVEEITVRFAEYLRNERGLAEATVASYVSQGAVFLRWRLDEYRCDWASLTAVQVHEFVCVRAQGQRSRSVQVGINAVRALLRWMGGQKLVAVGLADGIGPVAARTMSPALPKALTDAQVVCVDSRYRCEGEMPRLIVVWLGLRSAGPPMWRLAAVGHWC